MCNESLLILYSILTLFLQSSVRHNLSSSRAFLKMERCGGDRGKGFFWSVDESHAQSLEEQELKAKQAAAAAAQGVPIESTSKKSKKDKAALLEPPLKRSVKGDFKGMPLPPPLTSSPLSFKSPTPSAATSASTTVASTSLSEPPTNVSVKPTLTSTPTTSATTGVFAYPSQSYGVQTLPQTGTTTSAYSSTPLSGSNPYAGLAQSNWAKQANVLPQQSVSPSVSAATSTAAPATATTSQPAATGQSAVPDVVIPIILGPIPPTHPDYSPNHPNNSAKEGYMILHERKLILDPDIFAQLTKEMLEKLEAMGAREALKILTEHMIRALKERRARERGKERGGRRPRGTGRGGAAARKTAAPTTTPFTNVPLDHKRRLLDAAGASAPQSAANATGVNGQVATKPPDAAQSTTPAVLTGQDPPVAASPGPPPADPGSPIIVVDDVSEEEGPASKKRKLDDAAMVTV